MAATRAACPSACTEPTNAVVKGRTGRVPVMLSCIAFSGTGTTIEQGVHVVSVDDRVDVRARGVRCDREPPGSPDLDAWGVGYGCGSSADSSAMKVAKRRATSGWTWNVALT